MKSNEDNEASENVDGYGYNMDQWILDMKQFV